MEKVETTEVQVEEPTEEEQEEEESVKEEDSGDEDEEDSDADDEMEGIDLLRQLLPCTMLDLIYLFVFQIIINNYMIAENCCLSSILLILSTFSFTENYAHYSILKQIIITS